MRCECGDSITGECGEGCPAMYGGSMPYANKPNPFEAGKAAGVLQERERCSRIVDSAYKEYDEPDPRLDACRATLSCIIRSGV